MIFVTKSYIRQIMLKNVFWVNCVLFILSHVQKTISIYNLARRQL